MKYDEISELAEMCTKLGTDQTCFASCLSFRQFLQSLTFDDRFNHRVFKP